MKHRLKDITKGEVLEILEETATALKRDRHRIAQEIHAPLTHAYVHSEGFHSWVTVDDNFEIRLTVRRTQKHINEILGEYDV